MVEWTAAEGKIGDIGFGVSLHLMDKGVDTGPLIKKVRLELGGLNTFESIRAELEVKMVEMMLEGVRAFRDGSNVIKQQHRKDGRQYFVMHPRMKTYADLQLLKQLKSN